MEAAPDGGARRAALAKLMTAAEMMEGGAGADALPSSVALLRSAMEDLHGGAGEDEHTARLLELRRAMERKQQALGALEADLEEKRALKLALRRLFHSVLLDLQDAQPPPPRPEGDPAMLWEKAWGL